MSKNLKNNSLALTEGPDRAPARAMLRAVGLTDDDFTGPLSRSLIPGLKSPPVIITSAISRRV